MPDNSNKMTSGFWYGMMHIQNRENPQELGMSLDRAGEKCNVSCQMPAGQFYTDNPVWEGFTLLHYTVWCDAIASSGEPPAA